MIVEHRRKVVVLLDRGDNQRRAELFGLNGTLLRLQNLGTVDAFEVLQVSVEE